MATEQDDLHFYGNPQQITGMESGGSAEEKSGPGSIFDEDDVMSQIYHVLGMASEEDEGMEPGSDMPEMMPEMGMPEEEPLEAPSFG